jgi:hypothetical protein
MGIYEPIETGSRSRRTFTAAGRILGALKLDGPLIVGLGLIALYGIVVLYSASGQNFYMVRNALIRVLIGTVAMCALARVKPSFLRRLALPLWTIGVILLIVVDITGHIGKGAQRWLDLGFIRFQPSEIMKLAVPMTCAAYLHERPLPPSQATLGALALIILAFARPFIRRADLPIVPGAGAREVVVLLDTSYSMGFADRWERARAAAQEQIKRMGGADRGSVVLFSSGADIEVRDSMDRSPLAAAIAAAKPG